MSPKTREAILHEDILYVDMLFRKIISDIDSRNDNQCGEEKEVESDILALPVEPPKPRKRKKKRFVDENTYYTPYVYGVFHTGRKTITDIIDKSIFPGVS